MTTKFNLKSKIAFSENIVWREVDKEAVILNLYNNKYYTLNKMGTDIWKMFRDQNTVKDILDKIAEEYDVNIDGVAKDVEKIIKELCREELIEIK
ncbi:MAG: PqqD family protein [Elusimicrobia bacterium]|nr:PqqD family protein [Candidatus Liberimonas magnetica]